MSDFDFHDADGLDGFGGPHLNNQPEVAWDRAETDPCERGTVGCSVRHPQAGPETSCETW